jgi:hypothetical protein
MKIPVIPHPIFCPGFSRAGRNKHRTTLDHREPCSKPASWQDLFLLTIVLVLGLAWVQPARAQVTFQRLHSFSDTGGDGIAPTSALIQGSDGTLYESTGLSGGGTVFKLNTDGSGFTVLYTFTVTAVPDGLSPCAALLQGKDGSFYGTTFEGGEMDDGIIFGLIAQIPMLYINQSGGTVTVLWQDATGWSLQQNNNLANTGGWSVNNSWTTSSGTNYLNLTSPAGNLFFRLGNP